MNATLKTLNARKKYVDDESSTKRFFTNIYVKIQNLGKALLFPIAMLPFAAIMLRVGAQIPGTTDFSKFIGTLIITLGNSVFSALPFFFAIGVAFGLAKDNRGEAALIAFSGMVFVTILVSSSKGWFGGIDLVDQIYGKVDLNIAGKSTMGFHEIFGGKYNSVLAQNVLLGISIGSVVSVIYNKFRGIELPPILAFFSGRRLIPVLSLIALTLFGILWAVLFPWVGYGLYEFSSSLSEATGDRWANAGIMGVYGFINRLLIPFGLHHIPNTIFWFQLGESVDALGKPVHGDIFIFLNGVAKGNTAGTFQSGFFPIMMFGLPALAFAFYHNAQGNVQKSRVASVFAGASLVSFFTGITEPIEFAFLYVSPLLYLVHAVLTGVFGMIVGFFGIQLGFGFSAGFIDYVLSVPKSLDIIAANKSGANAAFAHPAWLFVIGAITSVVYFSIANIMIKKLNLSTPGRGNNLIQWERDRKKDVSSGESKYRKDSLEILAAVGGLKNVVRVTNCATRLRFDLRDASLVDKVALSKTIAMGSIRLSKNTYQVIIGPTVEFYANEIQDLIKE